jgi:hypothetical protein
VQAHQLGLDVHQFRHRRRDAEQERAACRHDAAGDHHGPPALDQHDVPPEDGRQQSAKNHRNGKGEKGDDHAVSDTQTFKAVKEKLCFYRRKARPWKACAEKVGSLAVALGRVAL